MQKQQALAVASTKTAVLQEHPQYLLELFIRLRQFTDLSLKDSISVVLGMSRESEFKVNYQDIPQLINTYDNITNQDKGAYQKVIETLKSFYTQPHSQLANLLWVELYLNNYRHSFNENLFMNEYVKLCNYLIKKEN
ncbi:hypothetical protein M0R04_05555 [Candidatus Dojkabacteria bacterium]|jgi:hypothetical protein|nr:hypothetical protein [Candidatus Dojkabacteria bacterium]